MQAGCHLLRRKAPVRELNRNCNLLRLLLYCLLTTHCTRIYCRSLTVYILKYRTTSFSEAYLIFVSIKVWGKIFHQKNTNLVKFDFKEAIFSDFLSGI